MTDYDSPWKQMLAHDFPAFLEFFFPAAYAGIDWTQGYTLLDKELQKVVRDATLGQRRADQLVSVTGRDGLEDRLWAEIEDFDEEKQMHYLASFERKAQQIGMEKGIGKGQARLLNRLIQQRFGALPPDLEARLQAAAPEQLETWALRLLTASSLEDVFGAGGEPEPKPH